MLRPDVDVVGLTLRPEPDGRFTVSAVLDFDGKPAVPDVKSGDVLLGVDGAPATGATLGQVWSLLRWNARTDSIPDPRARRKAFHRRCARAPIPCTEERARL